MEGEPARGCLDTDACLLTKNVDHFQRIEDLKVIGLEQI